MTIDEERKIAGDVTTEVAIKHLEQYVGNDCYTTKMQTVCQMAITALRSQQKAEQQGPCSRCGYGGEHLEAPPCTSCPAHPKEIEENAPLTLDELREMDGKPVYLTADNRWYIVNNNYLTPYGKRIPCGIDKWGQGTSLSLLAECGMYRRKPEEGK